MATEGKDSTEWKVTKWIAFVAGLVALICGALTGALPASGAVGEDSLVVVILGVIATVGTAVSGGTAMQYIKGRSAVKTKE